MHERYSLEDYQYLFEAEKRRKLREQAIEQKKELDGIAFSNIKEIQEDILREIRAAFILLDLEDADDYDYIL